jgi:hypothetical protein
MPVVFYNNCQNSFEKNCQKTYRVKWRRHLIDVEGVVHGVGADVEGRVVPPGVDFMKPFSPKFTDKI